ncbi:MAG: chromate transporter, partial [Clostridia bacterium]|nr:chromate transporter [Clostridia bacterium]
MLELLELFFNFFMIGAFTFGGGYAMLPLIEQRVVGNEWMDPQLFIDFIAISESTPGPFAINSATAVGATVARDNGIFAPIGSFFSTLGVVLPSFIIILIIAKFYEKFKNSKVVSGCMSGLR